tara:strand:- start:833 stop:1012 length:180 start_codon:yes stop_codon:yes gene_type:complete
MEPAGFLNAPYEPAAHVPVKSRSFTDKDGKPLDSCKPVPLAQVTLHLFRAVLLHLKFVF